MPSAGDKGTAIDRLSQLDEGQIDALQRAYITSVEKLVGQLEADPDAVGDLLNLDSAHLKQLTTSAKSVLPPETQEEFAQRTDKRYSYGALNPYED